MQALLILAIGDVYRLWSLASSRLSGIMFPVRRSVECEQFHDSSHHVPGSRTRTLLLSRARGYITKHT
jgi:hypothetical protein